MPEIGEKGLGREIGKYPTARYVWDACKTCGKERWIQYKANRLVSPICRSCENRRLNIGRFREKSSNWKGGKSIDTQGYVSIILLPDDPFISMAQPNRRVKEHRYIMAKYLGRCLHDWESIHHKNGVKTDNRKENLELSMKGAHSLTHSKGYKDGYTKGYNDGLSKQIIELKERLQRYEAVY